MNIVKDLAIIGAGPAGMTTAIYISRTGKSVDLFEKLAPGGQASLTHNVDNYPGFEKGINGMELSEKMKQQTERFGANFIYDSVEKFEQDPETKLYTLTTGLGSTHQYRAILISTGTSSKKLNVKGEEQFFGRGIGTCAVCDGAFYKDKEVAVIGGGNSALEESLFLANIASKVYIIHRRDEFRGDKYVQDEVKKNNKIELILDTVVEEFVGETRLANMILKNIKTNYIFDKKIDGVFLYVGLDANTAFVDDQYKDSRGFLRVDQYNKVNDMGLFAAGDCCSGALQQIVIACGDGAKASYSINHYLG